VRIFEGLDDRKKSHTESQKEKMAYIVAVNRNKFLEKKQILNSISKAVMINQKSSNATLEKVKGAKYSLSK